MGVEEEKSFLFFFAYNIFGSLISRNGRPILNAFEAYSRESRSLELFLKIY